MTSESVLHNPSEALLTAARLGNLETVQEILANHPALLTEMADNFPQYKAPLRLTDKVLITAAKSDQTEIVLYLLDAVGDHITPNISYDFCTALGCACYHNNNRMADALIQHGATAVAEDLHIAIRKNNHRLVKSLLDAGADPAEEVGIWNALPVARNQCLDARQNQDEAAIKNAVLTLELIKNRMKTITGVTFSGAGAGIG